MPSPTLLAAIDLGSNSYRLEIGRLEHGHIERIEYLKETVRQGNGLDADRKLTPEAMHRGWACLARFAERLQGFDRRRVRAVATQTLREARNRDVFLERAQAILGFPIDVIPGREEARLIYSGVSHLLPQSDERRMVIDIGGRSTELILGAGMTPSVMESYRLGSVAWSMRYFADGVLSEKALSTAQLAAEAILDEAVALYPRSAWDSAYGASGTIGAVGDVLAACGWEPGVITPKGLMWLREQLLEARHADRLRLDGLKDDRRPVLGGGLCVLLALFSLLDIDALQVASGALRHGVLYDVLDRDRPDTDLRAASVQRLAQVFSVDLQQAQRVARVATGLFAQLQSTQDQASERHMRKLGWAASLHEVGTRISHSDYHKHGAYILEHADAPGFSLPELHRLGLLVLGHRGKLRKLEADFEDALFVQQLMSLRLAVILCHARRDPDLGGLTLSLDPGQRQFALAVRSGWAESYPQSAHLLRDEAVAWQKTSWSFAPAL
ncbi:MAG: exopolyphosphatase [Burkholderiaceae bacterium]